jgi:hypothetical protein
MGKKILPPHPAPPNLKGKKSKAPSIHAWGSSHWLHEISLCKRIPNHFLAWANTLCKEHPNYLGRLFLEEKLN